MKPHLQIASRLFRGPHPGGKCATTMINRNEPQRCAALIAAEERRAIRDLIKRIFAEAGEPEPDTLADWLGRDPPANAPRAP